MNILKKIINFLKIVIWKANWIGLFILSQVPMLLLTLVPKFTSPPISSIVFIIGLLITIIVTYYYAIYLQIIPRINIQYFKLGKIAQGFLILFIASAVSGIISQFLGSTDTANQTTLNELMSKVPFFAFALTTISAGFFEELVFRAGIFELLLPKHPKTAVVVSMQIFALLHIHGSSDLLSLIPYLALSAALTIPYYKHRNIYVNMSVHALWNCMVTFATMSMLG